MAGQTRILSPSHRRTIHAGRQECPPHPPSGLFRMTGFAKAGSTRCAIGCGRFLQPYISRIFAMFVVNRSVSGQVCVDDIMLRRTFRLSPPSASAVADPLTLRHPSTGSGTELRDHNLRDRLGFCDSPSRGE